MRRFLFALACLALPCLSHAAPADSTASSAPRNSLYAGMWALQFDVNGSLLSIDEFAGGVSLKRQFAPKWALRFGVGFSTQGQTQNPDVVRLPDDEQTSDVYGISIETVYQRYLNPGGVVNAYWGLGPIGHYTYEKSEASRDSSSSLNTRTQWSAGAIASFGVEWFFARQFSLHGEYTGSAVYFSSVREDTFSRTGQPDQYRRSEASGWSAGTSNAVRVGLSAYF